MELKFAELEKYRAADRERKAREVSKKIEARKNAEVQLFDQPDKLTSKKAKKSKKDSDRKRKLEEEAEKAKSVDTEIQAKKTKENNTVSQVELGK